MTRKVALVTGASRGIGAAIAIELSKTCDVIINYAGNHEAAQQTFAKLEAGNHHMIQANVANSESVQAMMEEIMTRYGRLDILVNNAGITKDNLLLRMKDEEFDQVIDTNLKGTYYCVRYCVKQMMKQKSGKIINMVSVIGLCGNIGQANYAASKGGIIAFTKSCAKELASRNIQVNAVAPGFIDTEMTQALSEEVKKNALNQIPAKIFGTPQQIADCVQFLASEKSDYINGQIIQVDGGMVM